MHTVPGKRVRDVYPQIFMWNETGILDILQTVPDFDLKDVVVTTILALLFSDIRSAVGMRLGRALEANGHVGYRTVGDLSPNQWRIEAEKMFRTSLARAQTALIDFARGAYSEYQGEKGNFINFFHNMSDQEMPVCSMVKVYADGKKSISLGMLLLVLFLCIVVAVLSINPDGKLVVVYFLIDFIRVLVETLQTWGSKVKDALMVLIKWTSKALRGIWLMAKEPTRRWRSSAIGSIRLR